MHSDAVDLVGGVPRRRQPSLLHRIANVVAVLFETESR